MLDLDGKYINRIQVDKKCVFLYFGIGTLKIVIFRC